MIIDERPTDDDDAQPVRLDGTALRIATVIFSGVVLLGLIGFTLSFRRVELGARAVADGLSPLVPIGVDVGILVFSATSLLLTYLRMPLRWLRAVPVGLTAVTIWLNVDGDWGSFSVVAHVTLPALWVVAINVAEHVVRHRLALDDGRQMDQVRLSRWFMAPRTTALLRRRMILWEALSYRDALARERRRLEYGARLRDAFGWRWRWTAPRLLRVLYRLEDYDAVESMLDARTSPPPDDQPDGTSFERQRSTGHDESGAESDDESRPESGPESELQSSSESGRTGRTGRTRRTPQRRRTEDDLYAQIVRLVASGKLPDRPTVESVRKTLRCSAVAARAVRRRYVEASGDRSEDDAA